MFAKLYKTCLKQKYKSTILKNKVHFYVEEVAVGFKWHRRGIAKYSIICMFRKHI